MLRAASQRGGIEITLHAGGMMMGAQRQPAAAIRQFVIAHDRRMSEMTGQPIGAPYRDVFLNDPTAMFDSEPPITAILAAEESGDGLRMLERIQRARFVEGKHIARREVLSGLAEELGIASFDEGYDRWFGAKTMEHVTASRALLQEVGGQGFPTFAVKTDGRWRLLESSAYLGRVEEWAKYLGTL